MADYNATINLPQTDFPMRAGLPQREPAFLASWNESNLYGTLLEKNKDKPKFMLHDGPPFSNGYIHTGTALNKILKDFVNRYKMMSGFNVPYTPGWDNHGMPIESAIIKKNKLDRNKMSIPEFRDACRDFAMDFVEKQREQFVRLGVLADWENPYLTMAPEFEKREIRVFGEMFKKGYIYKGLKPVYWCPHDETALAEAEIEYQDDDCLSVYVKFKISDDKDKLAEMCDVSNTYFVIWTTTTWTLPGNMAIALNPGESYVLAKAANGETYITAEALLEKTMEKGNVENYEIVGRLKGRDFEYMEAQHPFLERKSLVVVADYVTMESGTGCVHTAPGYGADDYVTGRRYNLEMIVPVDDRGIQTKDAGKFEGMYYEKSNQAIFDDLTETGALFASEKMTHSYPHCWRCKSPIIFRATPQWFCSVSDFKDAAVNACEAVTWLPSWGEDRIISMIKERSDWCISRQRHWGLPIPIFYCNDCEKPVCTDETISTVSDLFGKEGSNTWYSREAEDILPKGFKCPHCGGMHFTKETDTLDGWFDSGSSHFVTLEDNAEGQWPADLYLEGADQYRGWFQSSLLTAVATKDAGAPYKAVLTHGWVVDGDGKAMHKSLGNTVNPQDLVNQYGADILRMWVASSDYRVDIRISTELFKQLSQVYLKIRNTAKYILGNLDGFDPNELVQPSEMLPLDKWAITKLNELIARVSKGYEDYEYHIVHHSLHNFCVVEMSNFYLDVIKDRLYCEPKNSVARRSAQSAMYMILDTMVKMLAPIICFTADEIWQAMAHDKSADPANVMFNQLNKPFESYALSNEEMADWNMLTSLRDDVNVVLEAARAAKEIGKPLEAEVTLYCNAEMAAKLRGREDLLATLLIVSKIVVVEAQGGTKCENIDGLAAGVKKSEAAKCERCWAFLDSVGTDAEHPTLCARCAGVIKQM